MERASIRKNRFFFLAVIIAILNPVFSGLVLGLFMLFEPDFKKEGRIVLLFSIAWGIIAMLLLTRFRDVLLM
ncbi:MAG: hypothetical protein HYW90_00455 [Candidatus Sungbacteria bacterium]|nr:hypothetical protein [Candidatus Sungbacteria bacterium]